MHSQSGCRFKVWAFLKRNSTLLTHDQYRAGHVGFHCGNTRRLKAIRGYTVNIHNDDHGFGERLASDHGIANHNEPAEFLDLWDGLSAVHFDEAWNGYGQLMFDSLDAYLQAKRPARDKPGPRGLEYDQRVAAVGGDAPYRYRGPPLQFQVVEHVAVAVLPDRRPPAGFYHR